MILVTLNRALTRGVSWLFSTFRFFRRKEVKQIYETPVSTVENPPQTFPILCLQNDFGYKFLSICPSYFSGLTVTEGEGRFSTNAEKEKEDRII